MVVTLAMLALIAVGRIAIEPSDLYDNEQPLTISYTADMLLNGHWVVYYGFTGELMTKPPLYNWVASPFVAGAGFGAEWAHKAPAWLGAMVLFGVTVAMARRCFAGVDHAATAYPYAFLTDWRGLAWVAGLMAVGSHLGIKLMYLARPDGVLVACLAVAWWLGTAMVVRSAGRPRWGVVIGFWVAVGLAGLAKGLPALIPVIYVLLLGGLRGLACGERWSWRWVRAWGVWWGLPLAAAMVGGWLAAGEVMSPGLLRRFVVDEVGAKASGAGWWTPLLGVVKSPGLYLARALPWSVLALLGIGHVLWHWKGWRAWVTHPVFPAMAWLGVVVVFFVPAADRGDYLAPAMPAGAVLAAYWLGHHAYRLRSAAGLAAVVGCVGLAIVAWRVAIAEPYGENVHRFAAEVREIVGDDRVAMIDTGYNPLPTLIGVHDRGALPGNVPPTWLIAPIGNEVSEPVLISGLIPEVDGKRAGELGLYRVSGSQD
ncbi:MAG: hypothetical protein AAGK09_02790 [Planctomycetota bacterium]